MAEFTETDDLEGLKGEHRDNPSAAADGQKHATVSREWRPSAATIAIISGGIGESDIAAEKAGTPAEKTTEDEPKSKDIPEQTKPQ